MNMLGMPWIALAALLPHRCHRLAWFLYDWIEREQVLNLTACADRWTWAIGISAGQFKVPRQDFAITLPPVAPKVLINESDRSDASQYRSPTQFERLL